MTELAIQEGGTIVALLFRRVGDSLLATPALNALKVRYPRSRIVIFSEPQVTRVFEGLSCVDQIVNVGKSPTPWKLIGALRNESNLAATLDFLSDPRTAIACLFSGADTRIGFAKSFRQYAYTSRIAVQDTAKPIYSSMHKLKLSEAIDATSVDVLPRFSCTEANVKKADQLISDHGFIGQRLVALFVTSRRAYKRWPLSHYCEIVNTIVATGRHSIAVIGGTNERDDVIAFCRQAKIPDSSAFVFSDLGDMAAFLEKCFLFVGNDGGPKHLAVAMSTPTLTIFQNDPSEYWTPTANPFHRAIGGRDIVPSADSVARLVKEMLALLS